MIAQIEPCLFISDITNATCLHCLLQYEIKTILTIDAHPLKSDRTNCKDHKDLLTAKGHTISCHNIEIQDDLQSNLLNDLSASLNAIQESMDRKLNVLVHW